MPRQQTLPNFAALGLSPMTLDAVQDMGYVEPTPVQAQAIPAVLDGRDVMAAAQTGTGKTAAFLLPTLDRLARGRRGEGPRMLVVTPTRELAAQIAEVAQAVCAHTHHRATTVVGGLSYEPQKQALKRGCDLLVATPGRLIDLMDQGAAQLGQVEVLVLDEADRMLDMGFLPAMRKIVAATPASRQTLLFSATLGPDVLKNTHDLVRDPVRVEIAPKGTAAETVEQYVLAVAPEAKKRVLTQVLAREGAERVIVFVRGKHRADHLCRVLRRKGVAAQAIHGDRSQNQRMRALAQFASGEVGVVVATDVLARGIDIEDVAYVLNLDVPHEAEDYIHRIGRTGRAGETGWALTVCTADEYLDLRDIERLMGKVIPEYPHAAELDAGEFEPFLDPARNPKDKLPGKKTRKKIAQAKAKQAKKAEGEAKTAPAGNKPEDKPKAAQKAAASGKATRQGERHAKRGTKPKDKAQARTKTQAQRSQAQPQAKAKARAKSQAKPKDKRTQTKPKPQSKRQAQPKAQVRRRPGDRRGMLAQRG